jgi:hypothetical protein
MDCWSWRPGFLAPGFEPRPRAFAFGFNCVACITALAQGPGSRITALAQGLSSRKEELLLGYRGPWS